MSVILASTLIPIKTVSTLNLREHWAKRAGRAKTQRLQTWAELRTVSLPRTLLLPLAIKLTRIAPRGLDSDNLAGSLKSVRDGVADFLGIDDGHAGLQWTYAQAKGKPKEYAVHVEVACG